MSVNSFYSSIDHELIGAVLATREGSLWIGVYYRPPCAGISLVELESCLLSLGLSDSKAVVLKGDFNVDLLSEGDMAMDLKALMSGLGLTQIVSEPTHISSTSSTLLDHIFVTKESVAATVDVKPPLGTSDHCVVESAISLVPCRSYKPRRKVWLYEEADFMSMNEYLTVSLDGVTT